MSLFPSREEGIALRVAIAGLRADYRIALTLRYCDAMRVVEIEARMDRTDSAVHMLCYRGLRELEKSLEAASRYSSKES